MIFAPYPIVDGILSGEIITVFSVIRDYQRFFGRFSMAGDVRAKDDNPRPRKRRRQNESSNRTSQAKLRKEVFPVERRPLIQIRDIQRLLQRQLKANVREEKERALAGLKHQLELGTKANQDLKMAKRYQMVRFFGT